MFKLVKNELFKIFIKKSTWVMFALLLALIITNNFITKIQSNDELTIINQYTSDWKAEISKENELLTNQNIKNPDNELQVSKNFEKIRENQYYLEKDIKPLNYGAFQHVNNNTIFLPVISLLTIIIAAGIVSNEFSWGTIKLILIRPVSRTKILLSKYISVIIFSISAMLFVFIISWISGAILFGIENINSSIINFNGENPQSIPLLSEIGANYGYNFIELLMMGTFSFAISTIFRNSSIAIGISIFLMFMGNIIVQSFAQYSWAKYILFANTDLKQYTNGNILIEGMTLNFSIITLTVYYLIFIILTLVVFTKRDIINIE